MRVFTLTLFNLFLLASFALTAQTPAPVYEEIEYFGEAVESATAYSDGLVDYATDYSQVYDAAMPVPIYVGIAELQDFGANVVASAVELEWTVQPSEDVEYYEIEHSYNGVDYEYLSQINALEADQWKQDYRVMDVRPYAGHNYYRLVQYDFSGNAAYSRPVRVTTTDLEHAEVRIFPNPVRSSYVNFQYNADGYGEAGVHIFDMRGKLWGYKEFAFAPGINTVQLDIFELPLGAYTLRFEHDNQLFTEKFIRAQ